MIMEQPVLDLLSLLVVQEPLQSDEGHNIVSYRAIGEERLGEAVRSASTQGTRGPVTP